MAEPQNTYSSLGEHWSESKLDWSNPPSLPLPLLDDIDWSLVDRPEDTPKGDNDRRPPVRQRVPIVGQKTRTTKLDPARALQFGTYESAVTMESRDILYIGLKEVTTNDRPPRKKLVPHHIEYEERLDSTGWALVPCVAMRLCVINGLLHVYAARYAEDIWGRIEWNERNPRPGEYDQKNVFIHDHPLKVDPPRVLLIRVPSWLRRPLQILFHTAAYLYYVRCQEEGDVTSGSSAERQREAYYLELMSNFFTELCEIRALEQAGHSPNGYPSTLHHHLIREWYQDEASCHSIGGSEHLLKILPSAYEQDASKLDWENAYYRRAKSLWKYTMTRDSMFAYWRAHRCLSLDFFTDEFLLDFATRHTVFDINYMTRHMDGTTEEWCIMARDYPPGFDASAGKVPSSLYPIAHVPATYKTNDYERDEEVFMSRDVDAVDRKVYHWTTVNDSRSRGRRRRTGRRDAPLRRKSKAAAAAEDDDEEQFDIDEIDMEMDEDEEESGPQPQAGAMEEQDDDDLRRSPGGRPVLRRLIRGSDAAAAPVASSGRVTRSSARAASQATTSAISEEDGGSAGGD